MLYRAECDLIDTDRRLYHKGDVVELNGVLPHSTHLIPLEKPVEPVADKPVKKTRKRVTKKANG